MKCLEHYVPHIPNLQGSSRRWVTGGTLTLAPRALSMLLGARCPGSDTTYVWESASRCGLKATVDAPRPPPVGTQSDDVCAAWPTAVLSKCALRSCGADRGHAQGKRGEGKPVRVMFCVGLSG